MFSLFQFLLTIIILVFVKVGERWTDRNKLQFPPMLMTTVYSWDLDSCAAVDVRRLNSFDFLLWSNPSFQKFSASFSAAQQNQVNYW